MKLTKCENKHFYDADIYDYCPHCEKEMGIVQVDASVPKMEKPGASVGVSAAPKIPTKPKRVDTLTPKHDPVSEPDNDIKTVGFMDVFESNNDILNSIEDVYDDESPLVINYHSVEHVPITASPQVSLQSQVNAVSSHGTPEDVKTVAFYNFTDAEPVVGWLVCVKGEYIGQSFNLKAGQNFIGRALNMDVPLAKDTSVSRNKHAILTYDPQNRVFYIQPGESSGLTHINGSLLLSPQTIQAYEKIKVGNSELVFVPCCGEQFAWEDYL